MNTRLSDTTVNNMTWGDLWCQLAERGLHVGEYSNTSAIVKVVCLNPPDGSVQTALIITGFQEQALEAKTFYSHAAVWPRNEHPQRQHGTYGSALPDNGLLPTKSPASLDDFAQTALALLRSKETTHVEAECDHCGGVGVVCGMNQPTGVGFTCPICNGSARKIITYAPFTGRKRRADVTKVQVPHNGFPGVEAGRKPGDLVSYEEFLIITTLPKDET